MRCYITMLVCLLATVSLASSPQPLKPLVADSWGWPLGGDGYSYVVRQNIKYGTTVENTDYGIRNLDLILGGSDRITCFEVGGHRIYHAGVDLYRVGGNASGAQVRAIANGTVLYRGENYPGFVFIIQHDLSGGGTVYSLYGHLDNPAFGAGQVVVKGDVLGTVRFMPHNGNFPEFHPDGDDSHLHFEIRTFADATTRGFPPECDVTGVFGVGYTYPNLPDTYGYLDPLKFIRERQIWSSRVYLPLTVRDYPMAITCLEGRDLLQNGNFELGTIEDPAPWLEATTSSDLPSYHIVQTYRVYAGQRSARLGGWAVGRIVDEEFLQGVVIPAGATYGEWTMVYQIVTNESSSAPEDRFILTMNDARTGLNLNLIADGGVKFDNTYPYRNMWYLLSISVPNLGALAGQTVSLSYNGLSDNDALATSFIVDDVRFVVHCGSIQQRGMPLNGQVNIQPISGPSLPTDQHR